MNKNHTSRRGPLALIFAIGLPFLLVLFAVASFLVLNPQAAASHLNNLSLVDAPSASNGDTPVAHVQSPIGMSGGCWTYNTSSPDATVESNGQPQMYGIEGSDGPMLGLSFDTCNDYIQVTMDPSGYDYYKVDWWRPGRDGWTQFTTSNSVANFTNAWYNTNYEFTVDACTSHWYGDSCTSWSPRVYINS